MVKILTDTTEKGNDVLTTVDKAVNNGLATLDGTGKLTAGQERVKITVDDEAPATPAVGDIWIDTSA